MSKHTKGPWEYAGGNDGSCEVNIGETTVGICRWDKNTGIYVIDREEMEANANLIAAAPEMLEALKKTFVIFKALADAGLYPMPLMQENGGEGWQFITKAIEKAEEGSNV
jgi:hypothetical protein